MLREAYEALFPDGPEHVETVFDKLAHTGKTEPSHELAELERASAPTLVILGDDDVLTIDHAAAIQRAIPDSQLAVVSGTDHLLLFEKPELVNRLILDFLAARSWPSSFLLAGLLRRVQGRESLTEDDRGLDELRVGMATSDSRFAGLRNVRYLVLSDHSG